MFLLRAFPNITDDFLIAYRFMEILSHRWRVGACFTSSDLRFPAIHEDDMPIFSGNLPIDSISLWFGPPQNYSIGNFKNYAFLTSLRDGQKPAVVFQMNKFWELGDQFPYPFYPEQKPEGEGILCYVPPMHNRMLRETIQAYSLSETEEPLKILAPLQGLGLLENMVKEVREETGCSKPIFLASPDASSPDAIKNEILASSAVVDFRRHKSISFANVVAQSVGIPTAGTDCVWPKPDLEAISSEQKICLDGSRLTGEVVHEYEIEEMIWCFDNVMIANCQNNDAAKRIMSISRDMIIGE